MRAATMAVFLAAAAVWVHAADTDGDLTRKGFLALVERYEREKELTADQRMEAIEAFKVYQIPECARFLIKALPSERHPQVLRAMTVNLIVLGTPESVRTAVVEGLPRLGDLVQISERPDPLIRPAWTYRTREKTYPYRMLPEIYFGEIAGSFAALAPGKARDWIVAQGLGGPIEKDPLLTQFMITVIAASEHKDRARVLEALLRRPRDGQVAAVVLDAARQARLADARFSATAAQQLRHPDADVVLAAVMYLEKAAPDSLVKELPRLLKAPSQNLRMIAVHAAGHCKADPALLYPLLDDPSWGVRIAVFRTLGVMASEDAVERLIRRLAREDHPRAIDDLVDTLIRLTGVDVGRQYPGWDGWWKSQRGEAKIAWRDAGVLGAIKAGRAQRARTMTYYGLSVSNFAGFLLDVSASMIEEYDVEVEDRGAGGGRTEVAGERTRVTERRRKIDYARDNLKKVLSQLPPTMQFNIITFNYQALPWQDGLVVNSPQNRAEAYDFLDRQTTGGTTNIFDTLLCAMADEKVDTLYLLSDGAPTAGSLVDPERILEEVRRLNLMRKVRINTIGFDLDDTARDLMRRLADDNYGAFVEK